MVYITRKEIFSAAHRLNNPDLSDEENVQIYDKCNNYWGHGHNYTIEITVRGETDPKTGYLVDLKKLEDIIDDNLLSKVDHKHLNYDVDFLKGINPTLENMVIAFWEQLQNKIPAGELYRIKLWETENNSIEYYGE